MSRKPTPAPQSRETPASELVIAEDFAAANQLALVQRETETRTRAVAQQLGYQLPADSTDPDLIQRDISANMRRSVEACLEVGRGLNVLMAACKQGEFIARLEALGIEERVARRFRQSAVKFSNRVLTPALSKAIGSQTKLFEMLVLDDEQIEELELTGQTGELALDEVASMSVKELRAALRETRQERQADQLLLEKRNKKIDKLEREVDRVARLPLDEKLLDLQQRATATMRDAAGAITGGLRQAIIAVTHHDSEDHTPFLAGLIGQLQADLTALREEFRLPDASSLAAQELAAEVAQWAGKSTKKA